ncbi:MAG: hypothetical protein CYG59_05150, partial [Chloroflexi bacterium]
MGSRSTTSDQLISLPDGGGAIQGIGEKFATDLHTGTGNFSVPINLPPGRNGFHPQLSLSYSTGHGNGLFGLGWSLSIPGVSRKTSRGVPQYRDRDVALKNQDTFILSGAEDLVPVEDDENGLFTRYQPRTEGLFARIRHHHNTKNKDNYWEVCSKDGLISEYGTPGKAGTDDATIADPNPDLHHRIFAWKLTQTRDPFGNLILYDYDQRDTGSAGPHRWD